MNLTDRVYLGVHGALILVVCVGWQQIAHGPLYLAWNLVAIAAILITSRKQAAGAFWEFAHDWLPAIFFITVFEEVSFLSLAIRGEWQDAHVIAVESALLRVNPAEWMRRYANPWLSELLEFGYLSFYPIYPVMAGIFWEWRERERFKGAFRSFTDSVSVGYACCYATYLLYPTRSPLHSGFVHPEKGEAGGPFHRLVRIVQGRAGVHGNAFPSVHIMLACVAVVFAFRYFPRLAPFLLACVVLMCFGAVYDGYHYVADVVAGAVLGVITGTAFLLRKPAS